MDPELVEQQNEARIKRDKLVFDSGFDRIPADFYPTPKSLRSALLDNFTPPPGTVWEPCVGDGQLARDIEKRCGNQVQGTDIRSEDEGIYGKGEVDFFAQKFIPPGYTSIITNPPFGLITQFIRRGLEILDANDNDVTCLVALGRQDHHFASTRMKEFARAKHAIHCPWRPLWIEPGPDEKGGNPRWCFVWWIWEKGYDGPPAMYWVNRTVPNSEEFT